jgi:S-layer protein (TIGR01567 family)
MNFFWAIVVLGIISTTNVIAVDVSNIRGPINEVIDVKTYTIGSEDFSGFFYDKEHDLGTETIKFRITEGNLLREGYGVEYNTFAESKKFEFDKWGDYYSIGFLGDENFAGYTQGSLLYEKSQGWGLLGQGKLSKVLMDSNDPKTIPIGKSIELKDGYEFIVSDIGNDGDSIFVILKKDEDEVDSSAVFPGNDNLSLSTYTYRSQNNPVIIAIHFNDCFLGLNGSKATYNGIFQISDEFHDISSEKSFDKMIVRDFNDREIIMRNSENINLEDRKDIRLMGNFWIKTADQDISATNPLRFCIYKKVSEPGIYEIRGPIAPIENGEFVWDSESFAGLYNDLDNNIKTESIKLVVKNNHLEKATGVEYTTHIQRKPLSFKDWGSCYIIGFLGENFFAAYDKDCYLYEISDEGNLMVYDKLSQVLIDNHDEVNITRDKKLPLMEGYKLAINSIDVTGNKISLELFKDGEAIDFRVLSPPDMTYYYKNFTIKDKNKKVANIAVHFSNVFMGPYSEMATVDGVWQISESSFNVSQGKLYNNLKVSNIDTENGVITMNNDNTLNLAARDQPISDNIRIKSLNHNKFYLYKGVAIQETSIKKDPSDITINFGRGWF